MTTPSPDNGGHYQVHCSKSVANRLRRLQRIATRRGQGNEHILAFSKIIDALRHDPYSMGEPLYRLSTLRLQVRTVVIAPLALEFAVSETHFIVYLKSGRLLS